MLVLKFMVVLCFTLSSSAPPKPPYITWIVYDSIKNNTCDSTNQDMCQRCAKLTKAENVYPMCCQNTDDAQTWCEKAVKYGQ